MNSEPISARRLRDCCGYWALPYPIMHTSKSAVRTFAGLHEMVDGRTNSTFAKFITIAEKMRLPPTTVKRHVAKLVQDSWVDNCGRKGRRSCTLRITEKAMQVRKNDNFATLPKWFLDNQFPATAMLYATLVAEQCKWEEVLKRDVPGEVDDSDYIPHLQEFSLKKLQDMTGLSRPAIVKAKKILRIGGMINESTPSHMGPNSIILADSRGVVGDWIHEFEG